MTTAFVFPGQGSHRAGALSSWLSHPAAGVLEEISEGAGRDVVAISEDESAGTRTADAQPAIFAASVVAWRALVDAGVTPKIVAGHSLGEYSAAVASGALDPLDGAALVAERGAAMADACAQNPGGLTAVIKLGSEDVARLVAELDDVVIANDNAPGQVVLAGPHDAIAAVRDRVRLAGGRALPLEVEGAFHSPAMAPALPRVRAALDRVEVRPPTVPLVSGATAVETTDPQALADALISGLLESVRWREVQLRLAELGVTQIVEVGPGNVLAGLAKRTIPDVATHGVATPDDLDAVVAAVAAS